MKKISTDICVIGAGSGGLSFAAGAAQLGKKVVLLEGHKMGGDCLNFGCVPSKALLAAGKAAQTFRDADKFGIESVEPAIDYAAVNDHVHRVIAAIEPNDSVERFEGFGVHVIQERGEFIGPRTVRAGDHEIRAKFFIIATGSSPFVPPIQGLEDVPYFTNETIFDNRTCPEHLLVIGAGPIGLEMAQAHRRLGAKVTLFERSSVLPKDDSELVNVVREALVHEGISLHEGASVDRLSQMQNGQIQVHGQKNGQPFTAEGSHLLIAVGRRANIESLGLESAGVATHERGIEVDKQLRTSNKRIYALGDVIGGRQFTHVAGYHASIAVRKILFKMPSKNRDDLAPWVTYVDPELAHVGLTIAMAEEQGVKHQVAEWSFDENDRAQAEYATKGKIKVLIGKGGKILGCSIVGKNAGDLIGPWAMALANGMKISALTNTIMPYPTLSEVSKRAAGAFYTPTLFSARTRRLIGALSLFD